MKRTYIFLLNSHQSHQDKKGLASIMFIYSFIMCGVVKIKLKTSSTTQTDLSSNSTPPRCVFDYPDKEGNEICHTSSY